MYKSVFFSCIYIYYPFFRFCLKKYSCLSCSWGKFKVTPVVDGDGSPNGGVVMDDDGSPNGDGSSGGIDDAAAAATIIWCWK